MSHNNRNTAWWSNKSYSSPYEGIILSSNPTHPVKIVFEGATATINTGRGPFKLEIKKVIFNHPATIIYWEDGTKTVVKVQDGEVFDEEKGFAMAVLKKMLGNEGNYYNEIRKWVK